MTIRKTLTSLVFLLLPAFIANAGFNVPKGVFGIDKLEDAKSEAIESKNH